MHCALNWKWIKEVTLKLYNSKITIKTRMGYILDILLLINVAVIMISGVFISKTVFPSLDLSDTLVLKFMHISSSYFSLILIGIHIGFYWNWVTLVFKKIFKISERRIYVYISKVIAIIVLTQWDIYQRFHLILM